MIKQGDVICVGMSGGVDSSVAALLLKQAGYTVVGVFIKVWHPDFLPCEWEKERLDAMRVAAHLDIPFFTCNAEEEYRTLVAQYFIDEYKAGRTPNPDVMCNTHIKFGAFLRFAHNLGAQGIATGHYARVEHVPKPGLYRGMDTEKDQSYFLWNISRDALAQTLFPLGGLTKKEVRTIAQRAGLPTAQKRDSQGICFLGEVDVYEFLKEYITLSPGNVIDEEGRVIGTHKGAHIYTLGQRHGFTITAHTDHTEPHYVCARSLPNNTITVSTRREISDSTVSSYAISNTNWIREGMSEGQHISAALRYRQKPKPASIKTLSDGVAVIELETPIPAYELPEGQSCVIYDGDEVCGGGILHSI